MKWTQEQSDFVCWLRNLPRRDWAFCVPYEKAGEKPFYPDFVIVRKKGKAFVVDILEPHDDSRLDTWAKVKGLAKFADEWRESSPRQRITDQPGRESQESAVKAVGISPP